MHRFVTGILRQACSRHGQEYTPHNKATAMAHYVSTDQSTEVETIVAPTGLARSDIRKWNAWTQQPLELKVHLCATCFTLAVSCDLQAFPYRLSPYKLCCHDSYLSATLAAVVSVDAPLAAAAGSFQKTRFRFASMGRHCVPRPDLHMTSHMHPQDLDHSN